MLLPGTHCLTRKGKAGGRAGGQSGESRTGLDPYKGRQGIHYLCQTHLNQWEAEKKQEREMICKKEAIHVNHFSLDFLFLKTMALIGFCKSDVCSPPPMQDMGLCLRHTESPSPRINRGGLSLLSYVHSALAVGNPFSLMNNPRGLTPRVWDKGHRGAIWAMALWFLSTYNMLCVAVFPVCSPENCRERDL